MESSRRGQYGRYIPLILILADFCLLNILFFATAAHFPAIINSPRFRIILLLVNFAYVPIPLWQLRYGHFNRAVSLDRTVMSAVQAVFAHAVFFLSLMGFIRFFMAFKVYAVFYGMMLVALPLFWLLTRWMLKRYRRRGRNFSRVAIVGTNETAERLANAMAKDPGFGYDIIGFFDQMKPFVFKGNYAGNLDELEKLTRQGQVDEIFFTLTGERHSELSRTIKMADDNVIQFYYVPQMSRYVRRNFALDNIGEMPILSIRRNPLNNPLNRMIKRGFDLAFSSFFLLLSPLVFIPVAIGIKMSSPGPVFFRQQRTGYKGKSFNCLKFRTMRVNAAADTVQATADDPRKTRFGDFLRRTNIDELPQFVNVWLGQMSIVGPRPHMLKHTEDYSRMIDKYMIRHVVKPGITGWAQVNGYRGITDQLWKMERRVECDVWYVEHWNFFLDLKIIVRTVMNSIAGEENAF
ncbi:MAG: undecaprenyl-phosphate glucose phosphotransferase [Muribaculaceae bacterium]|nr:undecaprenyl-phosphate glucose phosphotransferase [Muribaculaceae bacterium]